MIIDITGKDLAYNLKRLWPGPDTCASRDVEARAQGLGAPYLCCRCRVATNPAHLFSHVGDFIGLVVRRAPVDMML